MFCAAVRNADGIHVMILTAHNPRRRSWRDLPQFEPISATRVRNACVIGAVAGMLFCVVACIIVDRFTL